VNRNVIYFPLFQLRECNENIKSWSSYVEKWLVYHWTGWLCIDSICRLLTVIFEMILSTVVNKLYITHHHFVAFEVELSIEIHPHGWNKICGHILLTLLPWPVDMTSNMWRRHSALATDMEKHHCCYMAS